MCNAIQTMMDRAAAEATEKTFVKMCKQFHLEYEDTVTAAVEEFTLSEREAADLVKKYW